MRRRRNAVKGKGRQEGCSLWTEAELDHLVEEATVDCYSETEQVSGLYTMIEDNLAMPFETMLFGSLVVEERIDLTDRDEIFWQSAGEGANSRRFGCLIFRCRLLRRQVRNGLPRIGIGSAKEARPPSKSSQIG